MSIWVEPCAQILFIISTLLNGDTTSECFQRHCHLLMEVQPMIRTKKNVNTYERHLLRNVFHTPLYPLCCLSTKVAEDSKPVICVTTSVRRERCASSTPFQSHTTASKAGSKSPLENIYCYNKAKTGNCVA